MTVSDDVLLMIDAVYSAGLEPEKWPEVIRAVAEKIGGIGGAVHAAGLSGSEFAFGASWNVDPECLEPYEKHYFAINPLTPPLLQQAAGTVVGDHMLVSPAVMMRTEIYNDFFKRFEINGSATAVLSNGPVYLSAFAILRNRPNVFEPGELRLLQAITPHLTRAVDMNRRLERVHAERESLSATVDLLQAAAIFVDQQGVVARINPSAERLLRRADGLAISNMRLLAALPDEQSKLSRIIDQALDRHAPKGGDVLLSRPSGKPGYFLRVCPIPRLRKADMSASAVIFLSDPDLKGGAGVRAVLSTYRLTPSEASVVEKLVEGMTIAEISQKLGTSIETVRTQLKRAMAKTETHRQAELVRLVLTSSVLLNNGRG